MCVNQSPAGIIGGIVAGAGAIPGFIGVAYLVLCGSPSAATPKP